MNIKSVLKNLKDKKYLLPAALALAAVILLLLSKGADTKDAKGKVSSALLSAELEERIEELCKSVDGVRYAKAFITLDTSEEYVFAQDFERNGDYIKVETVLSDGSGTELYVVSPKVRGAAIVCTGGDRPAVKKKIVDLISAALGIDSSKISVAGS